MIEPSTGPRMALAEADLPVLPEHPRSSSTKFCDTESGDCVGPLEDPVTGNVLPIEDLREELAAGSEGWTGAMKRVTVTDDGPTDEAYHRDYREFALSIADFALLYDPRDRESDADLYTAIETTEVGGTSGMLQLYCELRWRENVWGLDNVCGNGRTVDVNAAFVEAVPAWLAAGRPGDPPHQLNRDLILDSEVVDFLAYLTKYRADAAGNPVAGLGDPYLNARMAKPVAPPFRPESISVDHHDPYLVNYRGAPIPLRIGTKTVEPGEEDLTESANPHDVTQHQDCRPLAMSRLGRDQIGGGVVDALENGTFEQCSIDRQRQGQGGDLAFAFSSPTHGDPETPLLEAFADEKLVFRMIQGAQEVQHTFRLDGQSWQRNIDQEFASGMLPPDVTNTLDSSPRLDCFRRASGGYPLAYPKWRDDPNYVDNLPIGEQVEKGYWEAFEETIAECDNIEGYTFALEIGISEHFELSGSLRSDVGSSLEFNGSEGLALGVPVTGEADSVPDDSSDYRYSFGSVDADWNGAWGLMRIYADGNATDPVTGTRIGDRLVAVTRGQETFAATSTEIDIQEGSLTCPIPEPGGDPQIVVDALAVAVETRELWADGTTYRAGKTDADGLFLALITTSDLQETIAGLEGLALEDVLSVEVEFDALPRTTVIQAVRDVYDPAEEPNLRPFVLRVRAGDCVRLRLINTLEPSGPDLWAGLPDGLGDARMPPITPLNVGPKLEVTDAENRIGQVETLPSQANDVRPSAHLALSVQLPTMTLRRDMPSGAGFNAPPLAPVTGDVVTVSEPIEFYAGRARIKATTQQIGDISTAVGGAMEAYLAENPIDASGDDLFAALEPTIDDDGAVGILSLDFKLNITKLNDATGSQADYTVTAAVLEAEADLAAHTCTSAPCDPIPFATVVDLVNEARRLAYFGIHERTHWIPYAFGPVPVNAVSDVISQPVHGLFGIVDVVPRTWAGQGTTLYRDDLATDIPIPFDAHAICQMQGADNQDCRDLEAQDRKFRTVPAQHVPTGDGAPMVYSVEHEGGSYTLREFVVFYQDGQNHWDAGSDFRWLSEAGAIAVDSSNGAEVKAVPECPVCDDSYDLGDRGVSYRSIDFAGRLRQMHGTTAELSDDLNVFVFPHDNPESPGSFFNPDDAFRLKAEPGERVIVRVIHPGGRARQRAFAMNGFTYDDLFPGFGFPRSALLAPGKAVTAHLEPEVSCGTTLWGDGPTHIRSGGVWGLLEVTGGTCAAE